MSKAIYTENKCIRERLRKFIAGKTGDFPILQAAINIGCLVNSIYTPLRELEDEGLLKRKKTYFSILPAIPLQEPTDRWRQVKKNGHLEWENIPKTRDEILKIAGQYADNYEKENGFTTHPKTASFHGYIAGYDDAKLDKISQPQEPTETEDELWVEIFNDLDKWAKSWKSSSDTIPKIQELISRYSITRKK